MEPLQKTTSTRASLRFLLVEDNWQHADIVKEWLEDQFSGSVVRKMRTAKEFHDAFEEIVLDPPDVIILDVMVQYTDADDEDLRDEIADEQDMFTAGARCYDKLASRDLAGRAIVYSVIREEDLRKQHLDYLLSAYVQKRPDKENLLGAIKRILP